MGCKETKGVSVLKEEVGKHDNCEEGKKVSDEGAREITGMDVGSLVVLEKGWTVGEKV